MLKLKQGEDQLLNEVELAQELNTTKQTLDALRREKGLPYYRLTIKDRVYKVSEIIKWLEQNGRAS
jgi:hypothetical protein